MIRKFFGKLMHLFGFWEKRPDGAGDDDFEMNVDGVSNRQALRIQRALSNQQRLRDLEYRKSRSQSKNWQKWR